MLRQTDLDALKQAEIAACKKSIKRLVGTDPRYGIEILSASLGGCEIATLEEFSCTFQEGVFAPGSENIPGTVYMLFRPINLILKDDAVLPLREYTMAVRPHTSQPRFTNKAATPVVKAKSGKVLGFVVADYPTDNQIGSLVLPAALFLG